MDTDAYIQRLAESNPLREPTLRAVIQALHLPSGSRGLDVGCGIGLQALLLAEAVGPAGHVTGLDLSPEFLLHAEKIVSRAGLADRISFRQGSMNDLPFADHTFDWVWSADCVGYPVGEWLPVLREIVRVVKPGGSLAILAWTSQQLLPGYPLLEARLNATCSAFAPFVDGQRPEAHFTRALRWFREAGLETCTAQTFVGDVQAPLSDGVRQAVTSLFEMLWGERQPGVSAQDWSEYQRLCRPGSPDFVLNLPDYYAFFTYTIFRGEVPNPASRNRTGVE
jgi:demethylmenaquinone methyltransferase/2-methoxy-6-polyprenyl-1,4-benzoquinol methylase